MRERLSLGDAEATAGSALNHPLIRALLHNTALLPSDLHLLDEETVSPSDCAER